MNISVFIHSLQDRVARHAHRNAELAQRIDEITVDLANAKGEAKALTADNDRLSKLNKELSTTLRAISAENTGMMVVTMVVMIQKRENE